MSTASMATSLGLSKVFILDKYFSELQKFWETEKRLQGKMKRRGGIVSLLICMWSETRVSSSSKMEKSHKGGEKKFDELLLLSPPPFRGGVSIRKCQGIMAVFYFFACQEHKARAPINLANRLLAFCCDVSFLLFSPRLSP